MFPRALQLVVHGVALIAVFVTLVAFPASAQTHPRIELAPVLGRYVPTRQLPPLGHYVYECAVIIAVCPTPDFRQVHAAAVGGRVTVWLNKRGAIEGSLWSSPSGVEEPNGFEIAGTGSITVAGLRYVLNVVPKVSMVSLLIKAGPAVIHRSGHAWTSVAGTTSPGGAFGIGLEVHPVRHFGFRAEVEDYLYSVRFTRDAQFEGPGPSGFQEDRVLSLSLAVSL